MSVSVSVCLCLTTNPRRQSTPKTTPDPRHHQSDVKGKSNRPTDFPALRLCHYAKPWLRRFYYVFVHMQRDPLAAPRSHLTRPVVSNATSPTHAPFLPVDLVMRGAPPWGDCLYCRKSQGVQNWSTRGGDCCWVPAGRIRPAAAVVVCVSFYSGLIITPLLLFERLKSLHMCFMLYSFEDSPRGPWRKGKKISGQNLLF